MTLPVVLFFLTSWSQLRVIDDDDRIHRHEPQAFPRWTSQSSASRQVVVTPTSRKKSRKSKATTSDRTSRLKLKTSSGSQQHAHKTSLDRQKNFISSTTTTTTPVEPVRLPNRFLSGLNADDVAHQRMSYDTKLFPVLPLDYRSSSRFPVPVHFVVGATPASLDSPSLPTKWLLDGLEQSQYLQVVAVSYYHNARHVWTARRVARGMELSPPSVRANSTPLVWAVDWSSLQQDCHALLRVLQSEATHPFPTSQQYLLLLDSSGSARQDLTCRPLLAKYFDDNKIRMAKRSIVANRFWSDHDQWVNIGQVVAPQPLTVDQIGKSARPPPVLHMPLVVRDDIVKLLCNFTTAYNGGLDKKQEHRFVTYPVHAKRFADVTFFWRKGDYSHYGKLRRRVSEIVQSLNNVIVDAKHGGRKQQRVRTLVRIFGDEDGAEQEIAQYDYVQQLLSTKIVVVAQRDEWEDQYPLLEAMAGGAMVMTDAMLSLPSGLVDGQHVVVYDSAKSLRELILFYLHPKHEQKRLSIAKAGWELVMQRHRSWHRMEETIFGKPLTAVNPPFQVTPVAVTSS